MALKVNARGGIFCSAHTALSGLKKSCRAARLNPWPQVNAPLPCNPWEIRLVTLICNESYLEFPVGDPETLIGVPLADVNCGNGYSALCRLFPRGKPLYGSKLGKPRTARAFWTAPLLSGWASKTRSWSLL